MRIWLLRGFVAFFFGLFILMLGLAVVMWTGWYNVAATQAHVKAVESYMKILTRNSIELRAPEDAPWMEKVDAMTGFEHYNSMCVPCHGAPGVEAGLGKGLNPKAPDLSKEAKKWTAGQVLWIVQHGVKMTGMPAWREHHSEQELQRIAGFVKLELPDMKPENYKRMPVNSEENTE